MELLAMNEFQNIISCQDPGSRDGFLPPSLSHDPGLGCCSADGYAFAPSWIKEEGQGSRDKAYEAMSDYMEVYGYKPETFAGIKDAFTSESFRITHG